MPAAHPLNAPGDWYVEDGCCLICAIPETVAPGLFAWALDADGKVDHCYVARQPGRPVELDQILVAARNAEAACIRYRGRALGVHDALRALGIEELSDFPAHTRR